jgi:hypothetical protein
MFSQLYPVANIPQFPQDKKLGRESGSTNAGSKYKAIKHEK